MIGRNPINILDPKDTKYVTFKFTLLGSNLFSGILWQCQTKFESVHIVTSFALVSRQIHLGFYLITLSDMGVTGSSIAQGGTRPIFLDETEKLDF